MHLFAIVTPFLFLHAPMKTISLIAHLMCTVAVAKQFQDLSAHVKTAFSFPAAHSWVVDRETCQHPNQQESPEAYVPLPVIDLWHP